MPEITVVHLLRHGEVHNPGGVLYGRLPGYRLSELGLSMAERVAEATAHRDLAVIRSSPLERAQQTAEPLAARHGITVGLDDRLIEAANVFEGLTFGVGDGSLRNPSHWRHLYNPFRPSWGEPYRALVARVLAAMATAREQAAGREALLVSHQLPIWITRCAVEGRRLWHDPRKRECSLASLTSFTYEADRIVAVEYSEPAADLLPARGRSKPGAGGAHQPLGGRCGSGRTAADHRDGLLVGPGRRRRRRERAGVRRGERHGHRHPRGEAAGCPGPRRTDPGRQHVPLGRPSRSGRGGQRLGVLVRAVPGRGAHPGLAVETSAQ